jgi:uncharacterized protein YoaH (UPF0181 family)
MRFPARSNGDPSCGVPMKIMSRRLASQRCPGFPRMCAGTAREQASHAVANDGQSLQRHRPGIDQCFQLLGKLAAIAGDVQSAVVVQIQRRVAQGIGKGFAVIMVATTPLQVAHAKAVHEDGKLAADARNALSKALGFKLKRYAIAP